MKRILLRALLAGLIAALPAAVSCTGENAGTAPASETRKIPPVESEAHWRQLLAESDQVLLVAAFYADWCAPCRQLAPILSDLSDRWTDRVQFYRVDVEAHRDLARRYRVRGIPYTVIIAGGEVVDSLFGLQPAERYRKGIERQLDRLPD